MNKDIEFRGYDNDTARWYYGSYVRLERSTPYPMSQTPEEDNDRFEREQVDHYIFFTESMDWGLPTRKLKADVDPRSVGQFTGARDKTGKKIYGGDILQYVLPPEHGEDIRPDIYLVEWKGFGFEARWLNPPTPRSSSNGHLSMTGTDEDMIIIGNSRDNPELLMV
jgi:uncharacterized phage protein (TIGR01671 family)